MEYSYTIIDGVYQGPSELGAFTVSPGIHLVSLGTLEKVFSIDCRGVSTLTDLGRLRAVGECAVFGGTSITTLGELRTVGGTLDVSNNPRLVDLGALESVGYSLRLAGTNVAHLGNLKEVVTSISEPSVGFLYTLREFQDILDYLRNLPASEVVNYMYLPALAHPIYQETLRRS